jgi:DNA-binding HxlR family transcriptional regulator
MDMKTDTLENLCLDAEMQCLLHRVSDKWTALIIGLLEQEPKRFGVLLKSINGISQKVLTQTLRELERNGVVQRTVYAQVPPRVEYALTPLGRTLCEPLSALRQWTVTHRQTVLAARHNYDARKVEAQAAPTLAEQTVT